MPGPLKPARRSRLVLPASVFHLLDRYLISTGREPDEFYRRSRLVLQVQHSAASDFCARLPVEHDSRILPRSSDFLASAAWSHCPK